MAPSNTFRIEQIAPDLPLTWALTERLRWSQEVNDTLKTDVEETLLSLPTANQRIPA